MMEVTSKCCDAPIHVGRFMSWCEECGNSVNPDDGKPYQFQRGKTDESE